MPDAQPQSIDLVERVARAMVRGCGQRMFEDYDDPNAADDRDWWRARAREAIAEMEAASSASVEPEERRKRSCRL
jgi:predicted  nucleic acid-binding Zn-ribbon protein